MERPALETDLATVLAEVRGRWAGAGPLPRDRVCGVSTDTRAPTRGTVFFALDGERFDGHDFVGEALRGGALACVVRRERAAGLSGPLIAVKDPLGALEDLAVSHRHSLDLTVTAVTGSVGKTTTKDFIAEVLRVRYRVASAPASFNNRLGVALTLLSADWRTRELVVEMGTSAPGEIAHLSRCARPDRAVITGIAAAHLSGLGDLHGVVEAKSEILEGLAPEGTAYLNSDLPCLQRFLARVPGAVRTFGFARGDFAVERCRLLDGKGIGTGGGREWAGGRAFAIQGEDLVLPLPGEHNVLNAAAAVAVARDSGLGWDEIREGLLRCRLPSRRLELERAGGLLLLDDSYNSSPASLRAALAAAGELFGDARRVFVLGDMLELGEESRRFHEDLGRELACAEVDVLVTVGKESRFLLGAFCEARREGARADRGEAAHFRDVEEAGAFLQALLRPGDAVLIKGSNRSGVGRLAATLRRRGCSRGREETFLALPPA